MEGLRGTIPEQNNDVTDGCIGGTFEEITPLPKYWSEIEQQWL